MFGAAILVRNSDKEKWVYSGYWIAFDRAVSCNCGNGFAGKNLIYGVKNSSSSHTDNHKNNFLYLVENPTCGINGSFETRKKV